MLIIYRSVLNLGYRCLCSKGKTCLSLIQITNFRFICYPDLTILLKFWFGRGRVCGGLMKMLSRTRQLCIHTSFLLQETIAASVSLEDNNNCFVAFDIAKAFDTV